MRHQPIEIKRYMQCPAKYRFELICSFYPIFEQKIELCMDDEFFEVSTLLGNLSWA